MLDASGDLVYINEPLNPEHPPGRSPGVLAVDVPHRFFYIAAHNGDRHRAAFESMFALRYRLGAEVWKNHSPYDLARAAKYAASFARGRIRGSRPLLDDPFAVFCTPWLVDTFQSDAVVITRHPGAIIAGRKRLGYMIDFRELTAQTELVQNYFGKFEAELAHPPTDDLIANGCLLWNLIHHAVDTYRRTHPSIIVVRHEDLSLDPIDRFSRLYQQLDLPFHANAENAIRRATRAAGAGGSASHGWSISRRGISRTGFRPMDSRSNATAWKRSLGADEIRRIRSLTEPVSEIFYEPDSWE
jgi:hypothetical protein